ncbi:HADH [Cordylochernes scorpioides]|uniref:3-hydroxyacyl-CoA dehydrogenase n=1 Tax=Cordylochernes scorpioides TaxID=51811 RepID=A0ABY6LI90_9ARAC|nr:HADH [Cordylochernes scorpioides]
MILANRRITVREIAEDLNISIGSCHSIFINDLGMRRVAAKFVPKLLNCDQKQHRMNIANEMLDSVRNDSNLLQRVITGDEAWVYGYDVETKAQSSQWKLPHEPRPKKARQVRSNVKVLLTVFFDCRGMVHHEFLPQGRTVNKEYYLQVMRNLREAIRQKRPDLWKNKNWLLHYDNAPAHTTQHLAPCDFFLFPKLKRPMKGRRYATLDEIKTASKEELKKILKNDFLKCFEDWKNRWHNLVMLKVVLNQLLCQSTRWFSTTPVRTAIKNVTVIGSGIMGSGIAQLAAQRNHKVFLVDLNPDILENARKKVEISLKRGALKIMPENPLQAKSFAAKVFSNISFLTDLEEAVQDTDLVVEAIVEKVGEKQALFETLDKMANSRAILTTNTSSLSVEVVMQPVKRKAQAGGLHFFNPVTVMRLLEVIQLPETSKETYRKLEEFGRNIGKTTVSCKDTPGFIVNRLLIPYLLEAMRMVEREDATPRDIDASMKLGAGHPMGPFELADYVGLDTIKFSLDSWSLRFPDHPMFRPVPKLIQLVDEGKLGRKSGEGFYNYRKE